jgi:hypothetical protein
MDAHRFACGGAGDPDAFQDGAQHRIVRVEFGAE